LRLGAGFAVLREADADFDARILEVEGVGVTLGAVADDGDFLRLDQGEVCVVIVVGLCHDVLLFSF